MNKTNIPWADYTWNPIMGCTHAGSPACDNCYARALHQMRHKAYHAGKRISACYAAPFEQIQILPERLEQPLHVKKGGFVFVCSGADLFHPEVPDSFLDQMFSIMVKATQHTFLVLTKRPERMQKYMDGCQRGADDIGGAFPWPNVWLGVTVEDQQLADERIPVLLATTAAKRFVSIEPMLGPVDLGEYLDGDRWMNSEKPMCAPLDWVIAGGETGRGARFTQPDWVCSLRDQCVVAGVPFFFKQWGEYLPDTQNPKISGPSKVWQGIRVGKNAAGHLLDGQEWRQFPEA